MYRLITNYRNKEAQEAQEVVTPPELVKDIYKHLGLKNFNGDVLDPCVGPGALIKPFLTDLNFKTLTLCDIQKIHITNLKTQGFKEKKNQRLEVW